MKGIVTLQKAADTIGVSVKTLRRMIASGKLHGYQITNKLVGVSLVEFEKLAAIQRRERKPPELFGVVKKYRRATA